MRARGVACVVAMTMALIVMAACAPKMAPVPVVTTPLFPDFLRPPVPLALAGSPAAAAQDRAWQFLQFGDLRSAEREAATAAKASPGFYPAAATSGYISLARKDPGAALSHFDRALELQSSYVSALVGRGRALQALERDDEAVVAFQAALAVDPSLTDLSRQIAVLQFRSAEREIALARQAARAGNVEQARQLYGRALAASPDSSFLYRELGTLERQAGRLEAALDLFRRAVSLDASDAASLDQIAEILEQQGQLEEALNAYDASLRIDPVPSVAARRETLNARIELSRLPEEYRAIETSPQITREQLAALIGIRLAPLLSRFPPVEPGVITDIRGNWAERWIVAVARAAIMEPFANHTFQPTGVVSRVALAPIAGRLVLRLAPPAQAREWQAAKTTFTDLLPAHLAYPSASTAVAAGVMVKTPDGVFQPSLPVTGAEAVAMIARVQRLAGDVSVRAQAPGAR